MKTLNIATRTSTYNRATTNNSTTVALVGLNEAIRLEKEYPSREFLTDTQRAKAVFKAMMQSARAGAYQVFKQDGFIQRISLHALCATEKQPVVTMHLALGRVVTSHTKVDGFNLTKVGYRHLIASLEAIADADKEVSIENVEKSQPRSGTIKATDVETARNNNAA